MANLPDFSDINLTKGGFYTLINRLETYLNDSIGATGTPEGVKIALDLDSVDNTSDANKPVSTAQQTALNTKVNITDVINVLTSTLTNKPLSAYQGKVLKDLVDTKLTASGLKTINGETITGTGNITTPTVTLTDSVSTTSSTVSASATAVKTAYDLANTASSNTKSWVTKWTGSSRYLTSFCATYGVGMFLIVREDNGFLYHDIIEITNSAVSSLAFNCNQVTMDASSSRVLYMSYLGTTYSNSTYRDRLYCGTYISGLGLFKEVKKWE